MNSLTYLSRQFDALASSSNTTTRLPTPRSTEPTTWSLRSLVAPPPTRRTLSIPATMPSFRATPAIRPKPQSTSRSVFRHLFFIRLFGLLWYALCAAVTSLRVDDLWHGGPRTTPYRPHRRKGAVLEKGSSTDGKTAHMHQLGSDQAASHPDPAVKAPTLAHLSSSVLDPPPISRISTDPPARDVTYSGRPPPQSFAAPMLTPPPSRTPTPTYSISAALPIAPRKSSFYLPKTLVLDLDETLIHSTTRPPTTSGIRGLFGARRAAPHTVDVVMGGRPNVYYVYKRPFVDLFLRKVSAWYTLVIFTASMKEYADPVIDWLDAGQGIIARRFFRESCTQMPNGSYTKDLTVVEQDLARICLVDNSPICYTRNPMNAIPIEGWTHDPSDEALLDLLPVLDSLRFTTDVRRVLGIRGFS
ncbi:NIF-domain-containing protein [Lactarius sanguifluus]|nr:NIF-domain-containing protein [Lactarius sanguifluus]